MRHRRNEYGNLLAILGTVIMSVFISELMGQAKQWWQADISTRTGMKKSTSNVIEKAEPTVRKTEKKGDGEMRFKKQLASTPDIEGTKKKSRVKPSIREILSNRWCSPYYRNVLGVCRRRGCLVGATVWFSLGETVDGASRDSGSYHYCCRAVAERSEKDGVAHASDNPVTVRLQLCSWRASLCENGRRGPRGSGDGVAVLRARYSRSG